jgi:hypothetical protein
VNAAPTVILYGRPGCHLCDAAEAQLRALAPRLGFALEVVNIELDETLHRRFMFEIPVVEFAGEALAKAPISARALEQELRGRLAH